MTRKEQIAKKAAQVAALATYKAILNPPVWKVAGTSFKTSPRWEDIAKAAAAASYSAVLKIAQQEPKKDDNLPGIDLGKPSKPFEAPVPNPSKDPIFGKDVGKVDDTDDVDMMDIPSDVTPDMMSIHAALHREAPLFAKYIREGAPSNNVPYDAKKFVDYVKAGTPKEVGEVWVKPGNIGTVIDQILTNVSDPERRSGLKSYLLSL